MKILNELHLVQIEGPDDCDGCYFRKLYDCPDDTIDCPDDTIWILKEIYENYTVR